VVGAAARAVAVEGGGGRPDQPAVDRQAGPLRRFLDLALQVLAKAEVDSCHGAVVVLRCDRREFGGRGIGLVERLAGRRGHDEAGLPAAEPQVHRSRRQVTGDLVRRVGQGIKQGQAQSRLQRGGKPLGESAGVVAAGIGGQGQLLADVADIRSEVHGSSMAPLWCHRKPCRRQIDSPWPIVVPDACQSAPKCAEAGS